jgi:hypothetical protein
MHYLTLPIQQSQRFKRVVVVGVNMYRLHNSRNVVHLHDNTLLHAVKRFVCHALRLKMRNCWRRIHIVLAVGQVPEDAVPLYWSLLCNQNIQVLHFRSLPIHSPFIDMCLIVKFM